MQACARLLVFSIALFAALGPASARVPPLIFCWSPDHEFPIACDLDEDDDDDLAPSKPH